jgi:hypothetical protein
VRHAKAALLLVTTSAGTLSDITVNADLDLTQASVSTPPVTLAFVRCLSAEPLGDLVPKGLD